MRILVITWFFPPWNESASGRPYGWARHFAEQGHEVTVLTCRKDPDFHGNLSMPSEPHPNLEVVETPLRLTNTPIGKGASWAISSIPTARRLAEGTDVIISTFMPWFVHLLGRAAWSANPSAAWCADYRDLWHDFDYMTGTRPLKKAVARFAEKTIVRPASLVTTVSPPLAERLAATHPHIRCETIYNGFPADDWQPPVPAARLRARLERGEPLRILYTGTIYPRGYHDPEPLFRALAAGRATFRRPVKVLFYGHCRKVPALWEMRKAHGVEDLVEIPDEFLSRAACVDLQRDVDLLLHLGWTNSGMDGVLSGKVFEYLAAGTPVLSVGAGPETAIGRLMEETGAGRCVGTDAAAIGELLDLMVNEGRMPAWFHPERDVVLRFSRQAQAARVLGMLEDLVARRAPAPAG